MTDTTSDSIFARSKNRATAHFVRRADDILESLRRQALRSQRDGDALRTAILNVLLDEAKVERNNRLQDFWWEFDLIFTPGCSIRWYDGQDMKVGTFLYHTDWHVYIKHGVCESGLPIVIDTDYEKLEV